MIHRLLILVVMLILWTQSVSAQSGFSRSDISGQNLEKIGIPNEFALGVFIGYLSSERDHYTGTDICTHNKVMADWARSFEEMRPENPHETVLTPNRALSILKREFTCRTPDAVSKKAPVGIPRLTEFSLGNFIGYLSNTRDKHKDRYACPSEITISDWISAFKNTRRDYADSLRYSPENALAILKREFRCQSLNLAADSAPPSRFKNYETPGNLESKYDLGCVQAGDLTNKYTPADLYRGFSKCLARIIHEQPTFRQVDRL